MRMLPFCSFLLRRKQPLFFLKMTNRMPSTTTPPTGAAMAMVVVIVLERLAVFSIPPSLSWFCWRLAADADGVSAASLAEGVLLSVDEIKVVGSGVAGLSTAGVDAREVASDDEISVGAKAPGSDAVPVEEIRDEMDSSRGVDAGGVGVWTTGVVGVLTDGADVAGRDVDCFWAPPATLLVGAVVSGTSEVGVVEVGDGDGEAEDEVEASAPPPLLPPCFPLPSFPLSP